MTRTRTDARLRLSPATAALAAAGCLSAAQADEIQRFWQCPQGGEFGNTSCWEDFTLPTSDETAVFDVGSLYTVDFLNIRQTDRLIVRSGLVTFDLTESSYSLLNPLFTLPSIVVGDDVIAAAGLTIQGGPLGGQFMDIGREPMATGLVDVFGTPAVLDVDIRLNVAAQGLGVLDVRDGAIVESGSGAVGLGNGSAGQATIHGAGTTWTLTGDLKVGQGGLGMLTVDGGGAVTSGAAIVGQQLGGIGQAAVRGPGSTWTITGPLDVGFVGHGELTIADGATVINEIFASIGTSASADPFYPEYGNGEVRVDGTGSQWTVNGDVNVGLAGVGRLVLARGGTVTMTGDLLRGFGPVAELVLELGGSGDYPLPAISIAGMSDEFDVAVELVDGFVPEAGDVFEVALADLSLGTLTFQLPALPEDLAWTVVQDANTARLEVDDFLPGDVNGDGVVNVDDLLEVILQWGTCPPPPDPCPADLTGDGEVGVDDLTVVILGWTE